MRVSRGIGQYIFNDAFGQLAAALIFLQNNHDFQTGLDVLALFSIHKQIVSGLIVFSVAAFVFLFYNYINENAPYR